jgi:RNA polymerase sigma factor (sigma-70 family)
MVVSPPTALSLLDRLCRGDAAAWRRMNELYAPLMRAWLLPRGVQLTDVNDLTQNAFAVILRRLPEFEHNGRVGAFRTWLRGIIDNVLRDHRRAAGRRPVVGDALLDELADPGSELNRRWDAEHDRHVLRGLMALVEPEFAPATWAAFVRTALEGRSAAAELGLSVNAIHIARSRVLARLRQEAAGVLDGL